MSNQRRKRRDIDEDYEEEDMSGLLADLGGDADEGEHSDGELDEIEELEEEQLEEEDVNEEEEEAGGPNQGRNQRDVNAQKIKELRRDALASGSWNQYLGAMTQFWEYSVSTKAAWVNEEFQSLFWKPIPGEGDPNLSKKRARDVKKAVAARRKAFREEVMERSSGKAPYHFEKLSADAFVVYVSELKMCRGKNKDLSAGKSTLGRHRAAMMAMFNCYNYTAPQEFTGNLTALYKGLKKRVARAKANGERSMKEGKDAMSYGLLVDLCDLLMRSPKKEHRFVHLYLLLCWNLMCRASNAANICFSHMSWVGDALVIQFAHQKNDQEGQRAGVHRHCYANPLHPSVNLLLAFALYWLENPPAKGQAKLFPGSKVADNYNSILRTFLNTEEAQAVLRKHGKSVEDIASHSARKGGATYCLSVVASGPSYNMVCIRCGWLQGGMMDTYIQYDPQGDQFTGRCVSGLPLADALFEILPPYFDYDWGAVQALLLTLWPNLTTALLSIAHHALASLLHHLDFVAARLPHSCQMWKSILFAEADLSDLWKNRVVCGTALPDAPLQPSGLSVFTITMRQQKRQTELIKTELKKVCSHMADIKGQFRDLLQQFRHEVANNIIKDLSIHTSEGRKALQQVMEDAMTTTLAQLDLPTRAQAPPALSPQVATSPVALVGPLPAPAPAPAQVRPQLDPRVHQWPDMTMHFFPQQDYKAHDGFLNMDLQTLFRCWFAGTPSKQIHPWRLAEPSDFPEKVRKRVSEMRHLMRKFLENVDLVDPDFRQKETMALQEVDTMYAQAAPPFFARVACYADQTQRTRDNLSLGKTDPLKQQWTTLAKKSRNIPAAGAQLRPENRRNKRPDRPEPDERQVTLHAADGLLQMSNKRNK